MEKGTITEEESIVTNSESGKSDCERLPCHVFLVLVSPQEAVILAQHVMVCFVIGSERETKLKYEKYSHIVYDNNSLQIKIRLTIVCNDWQKKSANGDHQACVWETAALT